MTLFVDVEQLAAIGTIPLGAAGRDFRHANALEVEPFALALRWVSNQSPLLRDRESNIGTGIEDSEGR
jgi:hypothetical protein